MARAHVGTSGWVYPHWKGAFYPEELPASRRLAYYAERFRSVEVNNTFYRLLSDRAARTWLATVPEDFSFAVKAHRYVTHRKRLKDPKEPLRRFFDALAPLAPRVGAVLFQLPPSMSFDPERLDAFLALLPRDRPYGYVFEFRNPTWHNEQTYELLRLHDVGFCIHDFEQAPVLEVTADPVYVRLHGPAGAYQGRYGLDTMRAWASRIEAWTARGHEAWCFFNNDQDAYATQNAAELQALLAHRRPPAAVGAAAASA